MLPLPELIVERLTFVPRHRLAGPPTFTLIEWVHDYLSAAAHHSPHVDAASGMNLFG